MKTDLLFKIFTMLSFGVLVGCGGNNANDEQQKEEVANNEGNIVVGENEDLQEKGDFLITAYMNNQLQLTLGEVADRNALAPEVKELSKQILADNKAIQSNLETLAEAAEIDLKPALTPEFLSLIDSIQSYQGAKFDSAFVNTVIEEHENDIERFNSWANTTSNPIIRREVTENIDILQLQLAKAQEIRQNMD